MLICFLLYRIHGWYVMVAVVVVYLYCVIVIRANARGFCVRGSSMLGQRRSRHESLILIAHLLSRIDIEKFVAIFCLRLSEI